MAADDPDVYLVRPRALRVIAIVVGAGLTALAVIFWFALPIGIRVLFTPSQVLTLVAVLAFLILVVVAVASSFVRADADGLTIRNALRRHVVPWSRVHKVLLRPGDPWALVLLTPADGTPFEVDLDADRLMLLAIQTGDGPAAEAAVAELTTRLSRSRAT